MIDSGASLLEVAQTHQSDFIRYHGGLMQYKALKDSAALKQARDVRVEIWWGPGGHGKTHWARQAGGGQSGCTQWKRYSTLGQLRGGENDPAGRVQVGELADRHDEAPDGQVAVGAPCEVLQQIRRVASCHNLAEQFPGYFVQRCDRPGPGGIPPQSTPDSLP